jgi:hypothetical protein
MPEKIGCNKIVAMRLIDCMRDELNAKFMTELGAIQWDNESDEEPEQEKNGDRYILIGGSHAGRLADALDRQGHHVVDLSEPGWRASEYNAQLVSESLRECLAENRGPDGQDYVVLQLFDNSCYFSEDKAGRALPKRDYNDRKYHVSGKLSTATREEFKELLNTCIPILRAGGECTKLILSPLARYVTGKCCSKAHHIVNFSDPTYAATLGHKLDELRDWTKALCFTKRIRNFKVVSPNCLLGLDLGDKDDENRLTDFWDSDPVHLNEFGYDTLADGIVNITYDSNFNRSSSLAEDEQSRQSDGRRPIERRQSWVLADETVAYRTDSWHGHNHGRNFTRGQRGGPRGGPHGGLRGRPGHWQSRGGSVNKKSGWKWPRGHKKDRPY